MRRFVVVVPLVVLFSAIIPILFSVRPTEARWHLWECPGMEVHTVCRDGMHFTLGWTCSSDPRVPFGEVTVERVNTETTLFSFTEDLPKQQIPHPNRPETIYYKYYVRLWQDGNLLLSPGEQIEVVEAGVNYTVQDCSVLADEAAPTTAFSYQGKLFDGDVPADGVYDLRFSLWTGESGGTMVGETLHISDVAVADGIFTVQLDFGHNAFSGRARWLEMGVRPGSSTGSYTSLAPRQELLSVPYASGLVAGAIISDRLAGPALSVHNTLGNGLEVSGGEYGIVVGSVMTAGITIVTPGHDGIIVDEPANDGLRVVSAGEDGIEVASASESGMHIGSARNGVAVDSARVDAFHVYGAGDDGIEIDGAAFGVYNPSPGTTHNALWANTAQPSGEWGLFTYDKIYAGNISAMNLSLVAKVDDAGSLQTGDVVAVSGMAEPAPGSLQELPLVQQSDSQNSEGIIGVVQSRMALEPAPGKGEDAELVLRSTAGPAQPGEYVSLAIYGVAYVQLSSDTVVEVGSRLTPATTPGAVRPLRTETIQGLTVTEGTPVIGVLLDAPDAETGLAPIFVTLR